MGDDSEQITSQSESNEGNEENEGVARRGKAERSAQAKAFYRAMYAGSEPDPEQYGISVSKEPEPVATNWEGPCGICARLQSDIEQLEKRTEEAENHYKRMAADFENYRKRVAREKEEFSAVGVQRAIEAILPALDDMDLAKSKLSADMDAASLMESLNMVYNRFNRCLEQIGIKQLAVIGELFDPHYHEPVQQIRTNEVPDGSVVHQLRPGYMFHDKVLRPSLVNVATALAQGDETLEIASEASPEGSQEASLEGGKEQPNQPNQHTEAYADNERVDQSNGWVDQEKRTGALTDDLPVVDVTADLESRVFEDQEETDSGSTKEV